MEKRDRNRPQQNPRDSFGQIEATRAERYHSKESTWQTYHNPAFQHNPYNGYSRQHHNKKKRSNDHYISSESYRGQRSDPYRQNGNPYSQGGQRSDPYRHTGNPYSQGGYRTAPRVYHDNRMAQRVYYPGGQTYGGQNIYPDLAHRNDGYMYY